MLCLPGIRRTVTSVDDLCEHAQSTGIYIILAVLHNIYCNDMAMVIMKNQKEKKMIMITTDATMAESYPVRRYNPVYCSENRAMTSVSDAA